MSFELKDVSYTYPPKNEALKNINLKIEDGEFIGIMGDTGSGKSTLVDILSGLIKPSSGKIISNNKRVGVVFQFPEKQLFESSVKKDVSFGLDIKEEKVKEVLEELGFDYELIKDRSPLEFSGGEKRKIALAGVLVRKIDVLILDETFVDLDLDGREFLINLLNDLNKKGVTIILVSHDGNIIGNNVNRLIYLRDGEIIYDDSPLNIFLNVDEIKNDVLSLSYLLKEKGIVSSLTIDYEELLEGIIRHE